MASTDSSSIETSVARIEDACRRGLLLHDAAENLTRWLNESQYAEYQSRLVDLIQRQQFDELNRLFWERIPFGTGGRRGPMAEFGSATINVRTISESAHGLAVYVKNWFSRLVDEPPVTSETQKPLTAVVAFDSRHRSEEFARRTASVLAAHGFHVYFFPLPRATPELSFAVRRLGCATGVMISASHNPPSDNGFKAYWSTGVQVLPPHDSGIIDCVDAAKEIPSIEFDIGVRDGVIEFLPLIESETERGGNSIDELYLAAVCELSLSKSREIKAVYTPLHGVGESSVYRVVRRLGFRGVSIFEPQRSLDGAFPNVPQHLPNPERIEVFEPAICHAKAMGAELVLASDPDADRMAVAVRDASGEFVVLSGNQLSSLLTDYVLSHRAAERTLSADHFVIQTLVTTPLVATIARSYGVNVVDDVLVGFKHIAQEIDRRGASHFVFGTEESIGFMAGDYCRDKDACVGAIYALELAAEMKTCGQTLLDRLYQLHLKHGVHVETSMSIMVPGPTGQPRISRMMQALRSRPPARVGPVDWEMVRDFHLHEKRMLPQNTRFSELPSPSSNLLIFEGTVLNEALGSCRVTLAVRPSGTEPKVKLYVFVVVKPDMDVALNDDDTLMKLSSVRKTATLIAESVMSASKRWMELVD